MSQYKITHNIKLITDHEHSFGSTHSNLWNRTPGLLARSAQGYQTNWRVYFRWCFSSCSASGRGCCSQHTLFDLSWPISFIIWHTRYAQGDARVCDMAPTYWWSTCNGIWNALMRWSPHLVCHRMYSRPPLTLGRLWTTWPGKNMLFPVRLGLASDGFGEPIMLAVYLIWMWTRSSLPSASA